MEILNRNFGNVSAYNAPYLLVGFGDTLRVQTAIPFDGDYAIRQDITTNFKILKISCSENGLVYAMSAKNVWCLKPVQIGVQIDHLLKVNHYQLALKLAVSHIVIVFKYDFLLERSSY